MVSEEELKTAQLADNEPPHSNRRLPATVWIGTGVTIIALVAVGGALERGVDKADLLIKANQCPVPGI